MTTTKLTNVDYPTDEAYRFALLDPRKTEEAKDLNDKIFHSGVVYGIEVTIPELAARCKFNLDPQHSEGSSHVAAIEAALKCVLPGPACILATIRPDLDSLGAMAVIQLRHRIRSAGRDFWPESVWEGIDRIAASDKSAGRGEWRGRRDYPQVGDPVESDLNRIALAGLARMVSDSRRTIEERVALVREYLLKGICKGLIQSMAALQQERDEAIEATSVGVDPVMPDLIAVATSTHRGAIGLGYHFAPVVIALNPEFGPHKIRKLTIAQFEEGYVNMMAIKEAINQIEPGWGGTSTILGSPQGESSKLTPTEILSVVREHLLKGEG